MKKLIWSALFIVLVMLLGCNNSSDKENKAENKNGLTPLEQGLNFAMQTQKVLAENLMNEINTKGTVHALTFCSAKAITLTDSMALALNVQLKRVSDKARNPNNKANKKEAAYITKSKEFLARGEIVKPKMAETNGKMVGYYPIITNQICMQCHGNQDTEVLPETLSEIESLYPDDKGIDYEINELRGIWVVVMNAK